MRIFLGITGASGAPYAARLIEALAAATARSASAPRARGRGARDRALRRRATLARRDARAVHRARARRGHALRRARLARAVRERLGEGRRLRDLPVLDGHARHDRLGRDDEPDPPRGQRRAQGGAQARALPARDAALDDPSREHAPRASRPARRSSSSRRASTTAPSRSTTSSTSSSARCSTSSGSSNALARRWGQE